MPDPIPLQVDRHPSKRTFMKLVILPSRLTVILVAAALFLGCNTKAPESKQETASSQSMARAVVIQPQRKPLVRLIELPGRVEAYEVTPLYAKATGYVVKIPVDIGDRIRGPRPDEAAMLLCELQVPELKEELAQKVAAVAQCQAEVLQSDASIKVADATVRSADAKIIEAKASVEREESVYARWQSEFQRVAQLADSKTVTRKVADETRAQLDAADAGRKEAAARITSVEAKHQETIAVLEKAKADAVAARSRLAVAEADQRRVAAMVDYTMIRAPFDGVVVERNVHTGHLVQSGAGSQRPLLVVMRTDPVRIMIDVPEVDAVHVSTATKVELKIPSIPGSVHTGTITRISWSLNTTSRTMTAEIDLPNPDGTWRPGQYVQAKLTTAEIADALSLPKSSLVTEEKQTFCYVVDSTGKISRRPVSVGLQAGTDFEIREGLTGTEQVISANASAFREGQLVEVVPPAK